MGISEIVGGPSAVIPRWLCPVFTCTEHQSIRSQLQKGKFRLSPALSGATMSEAYLKGFSSYLGTVKLTLLLGKGSMLQEVGE